MAINIEMNLKQENGDYMVMYPKADYNNMNGTLDIGNTTGSLDISTRSTGDLPLSRTTGSIDISSRTIGNLTTSRITGLDNLGYSKILIDEYTGNGSTTGFTLSVPFNPAILFISNNFGTNPIYESYIQTTDGKSGIFPGYTPGSEILTVFCSQANGAGYINMLNTKTKGSIMFNIAIQNLQIKITGIEVTSQTSYETVNYFNVNGSHYSYIIIG